MHLSLLSGSDSPHRIGRCDRSAGGVGGVSSRQHYDAVMRGCLFAAALLAPFAITFAPAAFGLSRPATVVGMGSAFAR